MCGIAGHWSRTGASDQVVREQLDRVCHRGPDAAGAYVHGRAAVGQTRLSVIDLVTGDPPLTDESGDVGAVLNGEIYNFRSLRRELTEQGHSLTTTGDTEVLAHLAETRSPTELASRLDGMFAFAVWDRRREQLVLGRDRTGKKPLYYWWDGARLVFGSEIKSVLAHPDVPKALNAATLPDYLTFGYVPTPDTVFEGIRSLPPGCVLVLGRDGDLRIERYWELRVPGQAGVDRLDLGLGDAAGEVRRLLTEAVRKRLVADVPLGAFLSGGVDSSAVVALMVQESDTPVQTFCMGFDDAFYDERSAARDTARHLGTEHHEFLVEPRAVDLVEQLVWHHDQPFGDSSAIPMYLLAEQTRRHVTVALSGDGGDELFSGYERFAAARAAHALSRVPPGLVRSLGGAAVGAAGLRSARLASRVRRFARSAAQGLPLAYLDWVRVVPPDLVDEMTGGAVGPGTLEYQRLWNATAGSATLDRLLQLNFQTYLLDDLLVKADRMSMAHGLEVRVPFLDHDLVELAFRLPPATKQRGPVLKRVLKHAVADLVPPDVLERPKKGFGVPLDRWFRGELSGYATSMLGQGARVRQHLDGSGVDRMLAEHASGARDHGHALWTVLTLEVFFRKHGW